MEGRSQMIDNRITNCPIGSISLIGLIGLMEFPAALQNEVAAGFSLAMIHSPFAK